MDIDKAFEARDGVIIYQNNTDGPFITGSSASPVGLDLPESTLYVQNISGGVIIWRKFDTGVNDWRQLSAQDIPFDPALAQNETATDLQVLGENLSNRHYGKDFDQDTKAASETTSGNSFATYDTLNFTVTAESTPNQYRLNADFLWGHNSASNDIRVRVLLDGAQFGEELRIEPKDAGGDQRYQNNIIGYANDLSVGSHSFSLQYRPSTSSRVSRMYRSTLEVWRVS